MKKLRCNRLGIALVTTILLLNVMVVMAFCLAITSLQNLSLSRSEYDAMRSQHVAEAGASDALGQLKSNPSFAGSFTHTMTTLPDTASVTVVNNASGSTTLTGSNGASIPTGCAYILSVARAVNGKVTRSTGVLCQLSAPASMFAYAEFGHSGLTLTGSVSTDSYNSKSGTYAQTVQSQGGNVGTNAIGPNAVTLSGATRVGGSVSVGVGGSQSNININGGATYNSWGALSTSVAWPSVTIPSGTRQGSYRGSGLSLSAGTYGDYTISGAGSLVLAPGTYVFDSLTLSGNSHLVVSGATTIYITGNTGQGIDLSGGAVVNPTLTASNLVFYGGSNVTSAKVSGGASAYFALYAPNADISVKGPEGIYGSVMGDTVTASGNAAVHYDQALSASTGATATQMIYWQTF